MQILSTAAPDEEAVGEGGVEPPEVLFVGGSGAPATQGVRASEPTLADVEKVLAAIDVEMGRPTVGSDAAIPAAVQAVEVAEATFGRRRFAVDSAAGRLASGLARVGFWTPSANTAGAPLAGLRGVRLAGFLAGGADEHTKHNEEATQRHLERKDEGQEKCSQRNDTGKGNSRGAVQNPERANGYTLPSLKKTKTKKRAANHKTKQGKEDGGDVRAHGKQKQKGRKQRMSGEMRRENRKS